MRKQLLFILLLLIVQINTYAQTLSENELIQVVKKYHPIALQAKNLIEQAKTDITEARGAFDPLLQSNTTRKDLSGNNYYNYQNIALNIPTWYGIELNAGIENVAGNNVDPQRTFNSSSYVGVSFSVIKNIVIDKRRAALEQSKILVSQSEAERKLAVNNILYEATNQYWQWVQAYREWTIVNDVIAINQQRIKFTKEVIKIGERPAIDSVEAITQLQYYLSLQNELYMQMQSAFIQLSSYTWKENGVAYNLPENITPATASFTMNLVEKDLLVQEELIQEVVNNHPELEIYQTKFKFLEIDKRLKFQELLPDVKVKYNQLGKNYFLNETLGQIPLEKNYQYAVSFAMPLRLSQARANYAQAKLKIEYTKFQQNNKQRFLENKIREQFNILTQLKNQMNIQQNLYENLNVLLKGEEARFENGESSLFLINSREQKKIETLQKLNATIAKFYKQKTALRWASGVLWKD
jgi:outer membrane protein TolC